MKKILPLCLLTSFFTIEASEIPDTWFGIPYPMNRWGISVLKASQKEHGKIISAAGSVNLGSRPLPFEFRDAESLNVKADINIVKLDYFVLPFLMVYGLAGELEAKVKFNIGDIYLPNLNKPIAPLGSFSYKAKGTAYGAGAIAAFEYNKIFTSLQYTYTEINMHGDLTAKRASVANARLGYNFGSITPYIGASYQKAETKLKGVIPGNKGSFELNLDLDEINPAAGVFINLPKNITLLVEAGWGNKEIITADLGWRF